MAKCRNETSRHDSLGVSGVPSGVHGRVARPLTPRRGPKTIASLVRNGTWTLTEAAAAERLANVLGEEMNAQPRTASWQPKTHGSCIGAPSCAAENRLIRRVDDRRLLRRWLAEMSSSGVAVEPVVDILKSGASLSQTDRAYGHRKGWARAQLLASVDALIKVERSGAEKVQS